MSLQYQLCPKKVKPKNTSIPIRATAISTFITWKIIMISAANTIRVSALAYLMDLVASSMLYQLEIPMLATIGRYSPAMPTSRTLSGSTYMIIATTLPQHSTRDSILRIHFTNTLFYL